MLQLLNETPFQAQLAVFPDERGIDCAYVAVKGTYALARRPRLAEAQEKVRLEDEFWGEPGASSVRWAGEVHLAKPGTDVVLNGVARAPGGRTVAQLDVSLAVANRRKVVRVFGDRVWKPGLIGAGISSPEPFREMPLVYERAFGGVHDTGDEKSGVLFEPRNPVGRGFAGKRSGRDLKDLALPNLEDPSDLVKGTKDAPAPACFGFVAPSWEPRRGYAGTYDEAWTKTRAPYLPDDFDPRFFHAAHPDLVFDRPLAGGERVEIDNVSAEGPLAFELPRADVEVTVRLKGEDVRPRVSLETVLIEPEESRLTLLWRAAVPCDKAALRIERVTIAAAAPAGGRA